MKEQTQESMEKNRTESLEIDPHIYGQLISYKGAKEIQ